MLALDDGGIGGLISLGILSHLEESLAAISSHSYAFRLCDFFDYIAGTSTAAIIAAGLARGMSVRVDGGMTPYNKPAFLLYRMATHPLYRLEWPMGEKNLLLSSIGTGMADAPSFPANVDIVSNLTGLPSTLIHAIQIEQDITCRIAGRCTYGHFIDRELRDNTCRDVGVDCLVKEWHEAPHVTLDRDVCRAFFYARYNADLSAEGLRALGCGNIDPGKVQKLDAVDQIENLLKIGLSAGEKTKHEHFGPFAQQGPTA